MCYEEVVEGGWLWGCGMGKDHFLLCMVFSAVKVLEKNEGVSAV